MRRRRRRCQSYRGTAALTRLPRAPPSPQVGGYYDLDVEEVIKANPQLKDPNMVLAGEVIAIPWCALCPPARGHGMRAPGRQPPCKAPACPACAPACPAVCAPAHHLHAPLTAPPATTPTLPLCLHRSQHATRATPPIHPPCSKSSRYGDNLLDLLEHRNDTMALVGAIYAAGLDDTLRKIKNDATLFAPSDDAFEALLTKLDTNLTALAADEELLQGGLEPQGWGGGMHACMLGLQAEPATPYKCRPSPQPRAPPPA